MGTIAFNCGSSPDIMFSADTGVMVFDDGSGECLPISSNCSHHVDHLTDEYDVTFTIDIWTNDHFCSGTPDCSAQLTFRVPRSEFSSSDCDYSMNPEHSVCTVDGIEYKIRGVDIRHNETSLADCPTWAVGVTLDADGCSATQWVRRWTGCSPAGVSYENPGDCDDFEGSGCDWSFLIRDVEVVEVAA